MKEPKYQSINPATGEDLAQFGFEQNVEKLLSPKQIDWSDLSVESRAAHLEPLAGVLRTRREELAGLITLEMGKPIRQSRAEIDIPY